jgi:hypothetical protein
MSMTFSHTNFTNVHQLLTLNMMNRQLCLPSTDIYKILIQIHKLKHDEYTTMLTIYRYLQNIDSNTEGNV